ncbi:MAG: hypothetical protein HC821_04920 [Lewinella sp.]|nr:hypothetical protein [Lewinella sp.]
MKKLFLVLVFMTLAAAATAPLLAQETAAAPRRGAGGGQANDRDPSQTLSRLAQSLELTEAQQSELSAYYRSNAEAMREEMAQATTAEERQAIAQEYRQLRDNKTASVLTPAQNEKLAQLKAQRLERRETMESEGRPARVRPRNNRGGARPALTNPSTGSGGQ